MKNFRTTTTTTTLPQIKEEKSTYGCRILFRCSRCYGGIGSQSEGCYYQHQHHHHRYKGMDETSTSTLLYFRLSPGNNNRMEDLNDGTTNAECLQIAQCFCCIDIRRRSEVWWLTFWRRIDGKERTSNGAEAWRHSHCFESVKAQVYVESVLWIKARFVKGLKIWRDGTIVFHRQNHHPLFRCGVA